MYRTYDLKNGLPPRIYRSPREIKRDISEVSEKISEISEMLNIRSLILDILVSERSREPEKLIPELEAAVSEASEALDGMNSLKNELSLLEEELLEVMGILEA